MAVKHKVFSDLSDLNLSAYDTGLELKKTKFQTIQGLSLDDYSIFNNYNDVKGKNYSINILTDTLKEDSFLKPFDKELYRPSTTTKLIFRGNSTLSAASFLTYNFTSIDEDSEVSLGADTGDNNVFTITFIDDSNCTVNTNMNGQDKFLIVDISDNDKLLLRKLSTSIETTSAHIFNYSLDADNSFITFYKRIYDEFFLISPLTSGNTLSAVTPETAYANASIAKISNLDRQLLYRNLNNFVFYKNGDNVALDDTTIQGDKNNYLSYYLPENINIDGLEFNTDLRFFNTQNQISNNYNVNNVLPTTSKSIQRRYTSILNSQNTEKDFENLNLGYNFYTKEYNFPPDKYTKFTLPDSLYPFKRLNINDSSLSENGAYAGQTPYFSDKVFKILDKNKNTIPETQRNAPLLLQSTFKLLTQTSGSLIIDEVGDSFENNGTYLCSWLSGNNYEKGVWYDRYYNPQKTSYTTAISGNKLQVFEYKSLAQRYFEENNIEDIYFDIKSNMVFEPGTTYFYQRLGSNYIQKVIDGSQDKVVKDTFNLTFTGMQEENGVFDLNQNAYDEFNLFKDEKSFSITFDLELDNLSSLNSYNIFGNFYKDGFEFKNNFFCTPFVTLQQGNKVYVYDNNFNLLKVNTYDEVTHINDILYLEQTNNMILVCNDRLIETSITGEIKNQVIDDIIVQEFLRLYRSRIIIDYNRGYFLKNDIDINGTTFNGLYEMDLNNMSLSSTSHPVLSGGNSIVYTKSGLKPLNGFNGKLLTDDIGVSVSENRNLVYFQNINDLTDYSNSLSTDKFIYDINTFNDELYVQAFDADDTGYIYRFNKERELLSTYNLNVSAVSGFGLEFQDDNKEIKLLSFSKNTNNLVTVDKFSLNESLSTTYMLDISSISLSGDSHGNSNFITPVSFSNLYTKYKDKQGDLHFRLSFSTRQDIELKKDVWNTVFTETLSTWDGDGGTQLVKQPWNTFFTEEVAEISSETFTRINNIKLKNTFTFNFNLDGGIVDIYLNGINVSQLQFTPNKAILDEILAPNVLFNTLSIDGAPLNRIVSGYYGEGGKISNLKIYDDFLSEDFIKYLHLENKEIDKLIFDVTCGSRSNVEELNNLYNYNIPGLKNNKLKIYIRNAQIAGVSRNKIIDFLDKKIKEILPANIDETVYDFDINYIN